jgi:hypothetical protein
VGEKTGVTDDNAISAEEIARYLSSMGRDDDYELHGDRVVIENAHALAAINLQLAHRINAMTGVRCFIAGPDQRVLAQIVREECYPYLLRTYADIREMSGETIRKFYHRNLKIA